jgi:hypothetical protein
MHSLTNDQLQRVLTSVELQDDLQIVLLETAGRRDIPLQEHNANVYCIDPVAHVHWQIQAAATAFDHDSFVWLERRDDGNIWAGRFFGNEYIVDIATGKAQYAGWRK